ncbi:MAG: hypothetical protein KAW88_01345 [Candidatus Cloacimonetes bacterium]|nr:hypothetical protein [Candidatus Cloacimonadota bacterium]
MGIGNFLFKVKMYKKIIKIINFSLMMLLLFFSCTQPNPKNPFDPEVDPTEWAPSNLQFEILNVTSTKLTWKDNCDLEEGFTIERKVNNGNWTQLAQVSENITQYTDNTINETDFFYYRVYAFAGTNYSDYSNEVTCNNFPTEGLIAEYLFTNGSTEDTAGDNHGTNYGALPTTDRFWNEDKAYSFDGDNDYIDCGNSESLQLTNEISISAWLYLENDDISNPRIVDYDLDSHGFGLYVQEADNRIGFYFGGLYMCSDTPISINNWHHVVATAKSNEFKIYIDGGDFVTSCDPGIPSVFNYTHSLHIGKKPTNNINDWEGKLDDIRIYNRIITASEVDSIYHEGGWDE